MAPYQGNPVMTASPLELPYGVGPDQIFQLGTTLLPTTESTLNNVESQQNPPPQSPSEQSLGLSEIGSASGQFQCTYCNKTYTAQYMLTKHKRTHTKPLQCNLCSFATAEKKDLHRHFWSKHKEYALANNTPRDRGVCPDCGHRSRSDNLSRHKRRKHGDRSSS